MRPLILRPEAVQVAALCVRGRKKKQEVLMITSRGSGRWVVPKGWPIDGKTGAEAAVQEAWEEAGVLAEQVDEDPVGSFDYGKGQKDGTTQPVRVSVYRVRVDTLADDFPEAGQRERRWMLPEEAANLVAEPKLQDLLRAL
ncbi:NUDIX hydrolase [Ruegeria spongiae]|uniref:NUDIX hydrolase n=1 Tax=Ruegeria spongiae TaxID=2942209 RepID=UPI0027E3B4B0|nr:NUDIX hydrolase [Ruegeria spongiae]